jgi:GT2 family glycosyltransferase/glycosyltransferase involved in cell wall biosynthesis
LQQKGDPVAIDRQLLVPKSETVNDLALLRDILHISPRPRRGARLVDVVVPVYRGLESTLGCLHSILVAQTATPYELLVINDASPELQLTSCLRMIAERGLIRLFENSSNLGFVRTANLGLSQHTDRDVVLLNSDTRVYGNWLDRLHQAAFSAKDVGTVTPFSNNATICSYPRFLKENAIPKDVNAELLDAICARVNAGALVDIPTGVGFCMYLRRECLRQVGLFDANLFGRGYGEENDFSLRAQERGWRNVLATDTFVYHQGGVSFADEQGPARQQAAPLLDQKHPDYSALISGHIAANPAHPYRRRIDLVRISGASRAFLYITTNSGGGTERHVLEMAKRLEEEGIAAVILRPLVGRVVKLERPAIANTPNLIFDVEQEYWTLHQALDDIGVEHAHVHHTLSMPEKVLDLINDLQLPYDWTLHDYYAVCPRVNLTNSTGTYCGEPNAQGCRLCLETNRFHFGGNTNIHEWRAAFNSWLNGARRVFVPHRDVARRLDKYFPDIEFVERRHIECVGRARSVRATFQPGQALQVAIIGLLAPHKGLEVVLACARDILVRKLPIRLNIIGHPTHPEILSLPNVACTGIYKEEEVFDVLERQRCHCSFFPTMCPETYSYTLSIALLGRLTPIVFDLGSQAARIREDGFGHVLPLTTDPMLINNELLRLSTQLASPPDDWSPSFGYYSNLLSDYYGLPAATKNEAA